MRFSIGSSCLISLQLAPPHVLGLVQFDLSLQGLHQDDPQHSLPLMPSGMRTLLAPAAPALLGVVVRQQRVARGAR